MIVAELTRLIGQPASRMPGVATVAPVAPAPDAPRDHDRAPAVDSWTLRRLRLVARRRVRVEIATVGDSPATAADDELSVRLATVSTGDPRIIAWSANRVVDLIVVHDGCGARVVGDGGRSGLVELSGALEAGAALSFCYDTDPCSSRV